MKDHWLLYLLLGLILGISAYNLFTKPEQIKPETIREIQREVLAEQLKRIPRDSLIIEKYYTIREVTKKQLSEFEQADSTKRDSLFWFYYLNWKQGND